MSRDRAQKRHVQSGNYKHRGLVHGLCILVFWATVKSQRLGNEKMALIFLTNQKPRKLKPWLQLTMAVMETLCLS